MATTPLIEVEQYLSTTYRPDCDYIDGVLVERHLGQFEHSTLQMLVLLALQKRAAEWGVIVRPELRLKIRDNRYRTPDVMVLPANVNHPPVIEKAPLLCVEIVLPDDRLKDLTERAKDYDSLGVPATWILDPTTKQAFIHTQDGLHEVVNGILTAGTLTLSTKELFDQL